MAAADASSLASPTYHLLTGTFNTLFLYLLAFTPYTSPPTLTVTHAIRANGPHQFLALSPDRNTAYATTWKENEPTLSAWRVLNAGRDGIEEVNTVPITATGSYIQVDPENNFIYSAGGPTGEVHKVDQKKGGFGEKLQELLYVPEEDLATADKTRKALRYGSHSIDLSPATNKAFVPHVGHNSIYIYRTNSDGTLTLLNECFSVGDHDGPRHVVPSPSGDKLYVVTEHTSWVDVYDIQDPLLASTSLKHSQRLSVIPPEEDEIRRTHYRGDTLRFSQDGRFLYATTRGMTAATKGYVSVWAVNENGSLGSPSAYSTSGAGKVGEDYAPLTRYQTKTFGGKANAVEAFPFHEEGEKVDKDWIVLTDDGEGWVWVLEWDLERGTLEELAGVQLGRGEDSTEEERETGASHAVWLS